jgi:nucleotide-binding universal stress UspA family protein
VEGVTERIEFSVNGEGRTVEVRAGESAVAVLRDRLGLTGAKLVCGEGVSHVGHEERYDFHHLRRTGADRRSPQLTEASMPAVRTGPVVIGFDGTPASERALHEAASLFAGRRALVVVVWEAGRAFALAALPTTALGQPPGILDIRTAIEADRAMYEAAERLAGWGAAQARDAGLQAEGVAVADDMTVADTLIRLARERDAQTVVVGTHGHGRLSELLLGSTTRSVIERAPCPVVVVRAE